MHVNSRQGNNLFFHSCLFDMFSQRENCREVIVPHLSCESINSKTAPLNTAPGAWPLLHWCQFVHVFRVRKLQWAIIKLELFVFLPLKENMDWSLMPLGASPIQVFICLLHSFFHLNLSSSVFCWICTTFHMCPVLHYVFPTWDDIWPKSRRLGRSSCTGFLQYQVPCSKTSQGQVSAGMRPSDNIKLELYLWVVLVALSRLSSNTTLFK